jgi:hypothetical protein
MLGDGISRVVGYLLRTYAIDPTRVVLAGEGTGATVVAATSLHESDLAVPAFAAGPKRYRGLPMLGGPGSEGASGARRLTVTASEADEAWWKQEAEEWCKALPVTVESGEVMPLVRAALGVPEPKKEGAPTQLLLVRDTPRARLWAETYALRLPRPAVVVADMAEASGDGPVQVLAFEGEEVPEDLPPIPAESLMDGRGLPLASGPFGGTTILVVPAEATEEQRAAWKKLEETDAIKKKSKTARLVVLFEETAPVDYPEGIGSTTTGIAAALQAVKDAGRSVVLIVPAVFCADEEMMGRLRAEARPYEDILDLSYLPGLGGLLVPPSPPPSK